MANEEDARLKLERLVARLLQLETKDRETALRFAELAAAEQREAEEWPEASEQRAMHNQRAEELAMIAVDWEGHAAWAARMAENFQLRVNSHGAKQGD